MTNVTDQIMQSLKGDIEAHTGVVTPGESKAQSHEVDPQTVTFMFGCEEHTFPYNQIRHMNRNKERIVVSAFSATVTVKGKQLEALYNQLRRYKLSVITESAREEEGQSYIESISVTYNSEEENHA